MTCQEGIDAGMCRRYRGKCAECSCDDLEITAESYNESRGCYRARHCHATGLPRYDRSDFSFLEKNGIYTKSRAERENVKLNRAVVVGWYRVQHGYVPLFNKI